MATEDIVSTPLTNAASTPVVINNAGVAGGLVKQSVGTVEASGDTDAGSTYRVARVPSNAVGIEVLFACDKLGTTGTVNVGLYDVPENDGAVVDADFFASALDGNAAALDMTHIEHESGEYNIADIEKPLWEALGLSADPQKEYDVTIVSVGAIDAAATMTVKVRYAN